MGGRCQMRAEVGSGGAGEADGGLAHGIETRHDAVSATGIRCQLPTSQTNPSRVAAGWDPSGAPTWSAARARQPRFAPIHDPAYTAARLHTAADPSPRQAPSDCEHSP